VKCTPPPKEDLGSVSKITVSEVKKEEVKDIKLKKKKTSDLS
jgi:hypothetical protein